MILGSRLINMSPGLVRVPPAVPAHPAYDTDWFFAPHMYGNPYQELLYAGMPAVGIHPKGFRTIAAAVGALESAPANRRKVLHLHWLNVVLAGADGDAELEARITEFESQLDRVLAVGGQIAWTVHNVLPHESYQVDAAIRVRQAVVDRAAIIHVMSPDTAAKCEPHFHLPAELTVRAEHAGYHGYYPQASSHNRRAEWGLPTGGKVAVILGGIKPYKGLNEFAEVFAAATRDDPRRLSLMIAGKPDSDLRGSKLWELAQLSPNLHVFPEMVADSQVSSLMTLADLVAIPYQASLNSGSLVLGLTYGKPVLARSSAGSTHLLAGGAGVVYEDEAALPEHLTDLGWVERSQAAAEQVSRRLDQPTVSANFAHMCRAFIDAGPEAARTAIGPNGGLND